MFVSPPSLFPGDGLWFGFTPQRSVYAPNQSRAALTSPHTWGDFAWRYRTGSAPNISGISVMSVEPPRVTSRSLATPSAGFAVTPEKASEPPHFTPSTRDETGTSVRGVSF